MRTLTAEEARRVLRPDGLMRLVGITRGTTGASRLVMGAWMRGIASEVAVASPRAA